MTRRLGRSIRSIVSAGLTVLLLPAWGVSAMAAPAHSASLAVLPFANASGDASQDAFADGITEELGAVLTRVPDLYVGARVSAFRYKSAPADYRAFGQGLGTDYLLAGDVREETGRIRLSARLIRSRDAIVLWSETYDWEFSGIFDIEERVAQTVAEALNLRAPDTAVRNRLSDLKAYERFVRVRPLIRARGQKPFADAAVILEDIVAKNPDYAPAQALLAFDYDLAPLYQQALRSGDTPAARRFVDSVVPKAERLARRATRLDARSADAYLALAYAELVQSKPLLAEDYFKRCLALDPNNANALHGYSQLLAALDRVKDSLAMRERLQALEPFFINYTADTAEIYWLDGQTDTALKMLDPFRPGRTSELTQFTAAAGRYGEAAGYLREMNATNYLPGVLEAAAHLLETAPAKTDSPESLPKLGSLGFVYLHIGAPERVMEYYESNLAAGYFQPISSTWFWHPSYVEVRKLPRFKTFLKDAGFVAYWRERGWPALCHPTGADDFSCD